MMVLEEKPESAMRSTKAIVQTEASPGAWEMPNITPRGLDVRMGKLFLVRVAQQAILVTIPSQVLEKVSRILNGGSRPLR